MEDVVKIAMKEGLQAKLHSHLESKQSVNVSVGNGKSRRKHYFMVATNAFGKILSFFNAVP